MIRSIAAIDSKRGIADDHGIPWDLPIDKAYFREHTAGYPILMGYGMYAEMTVPLPNRENMVATSKDEPMKEGFTVVHDAQAYLKTASKDIWVVGGAGLYQSTLDLVDEIYLTQLQADFNCTKFFPEISEEFELVSQSPDQVQNGITFCFQVWRRRILSK